MGNFFSTADDQQKKRVAVIGAQIPQRLDSTAERMLGQQLLLNSQPFEVVGVLAEVGDVVGGSPDTSIFIPLLTAEQRILGQGEVDNISLEIADAVPLERAMVDIERVMRTEHKIQPGQPQRFLDRRQAPVSRDSAGGAADFHDAVGKHRWRQLGRRRNRNHEHHARERDRKNA